MPYWRKPVVSAQGSYYNQRRRKSKRKFPEISPTVGRTSSQSHRGWYATLHCPHTLVNLFQCLAHPSAGVTLLSITRIIEEGRELDAAVAELREVKRIWVSRV